ncbi:ABC transporter ATP-binding protein [Rhodanobacter sp. C06]|uniref:ABC transporter permease n=1 Tax=Rhodanobacter sp. C06 TaxID=1945854 RepID=UPI000987AD61|nr:ABC transporter permease [Rhodanobacter sp. C06]OOG36128.1 ABC transporter ATP-binding protein [Rhodanobacter sp. C06]OOG36159.1 ABC transporter ATP-binding protein [Rhodanobacter sp. C06]
MFGYYLNLALHSLKRTPILTGLMVLAIGLGIGASMTMLTVLHVMTDDPMPGRSAQLYTPHLDPLPLDHKRRGDSPDPTDDMTWPDAMALLKAHRAVRQAAMSGGSLLLRPARADLRPFYVAGRYATADFFALFGVPFERGSGWSAADDAASAHVVVLSEILARKLFGTGTAVGQTVHLGEHDFRVIGVTADWAPKPLFYADQTGTQYSDADLFFLPLSVAVDEKFQVNGNQSGWVKGDDNSLTSANMSWLQFWVQLDTPAQVAAYRQYLIDYSAQQKALGRFQRPPTNAKLYNLMGWLAHENLVPNDVDLQLWLALGFLFVCMVNIVALLLAKFLRRGGEISVRRALGARRRDIFVQLGIESALIGVAGGVLGVAIAQLGLWSIRQRPDDYAKLAQMDVSMLLGTLALAVLASVLAGLLPAWRACHVPPALQLKGG